MTEPVWISLSDFDPPRPQGIGHGGITLIPWPAGQTSIQDQLGQRAMQQLPNQGIIQQAQSGAVYIHSGNPSAYSGNVMITGGLGLGSQYAGQTFELHPDQRQDIEAYAADIEAGYLARYSDGNPCAPPPSGSLQHALWMLGWRTADRERRRRMGTAPDLAGTVADAAEAWIGVEDMPDGSVTWHARVRVPEET